jgi:hypothetical protein
MWFFEDMKLLSVNKYHYLNEFLLGSHLNILYEDMPFIQGKKLTMTDNLIEYILQYFNDTKTSNKQFTQIKSIC